MSKSDEKSYHQKKQNFHSIKMDIIKLEIRCESLRGNNIGNYDKFLKDAAPVEDSIKKSELLNKDRKLLRHQYNRICRAFRKKKRDAESKSYRNRENVKGRIETLIYEILDGDHDLLKKEKDLLNIIRDLEKMTLTKNHRKYCKREIGKAQDVWSKKYKEYEQKKQEIYDHYISEINDMLHDVRSKEKARYDRENLSYVCDILRKIKEFRQELSTNNLSESKKSEIYNKINWLWANTKKTQLILEIKKRQLLKIKGEQNRDFVFVAKLEKQIKEIKEKLKKHGKKLNKLKKEL